MTLAPDTHREIAAILTDLPVQVITVPTEEGQPNQARIRGKDRSVLHRLNVLIRTPDHAQQLADELPAHLLIPPIWKTTRPRKHKFAWARGYMDAQKTCLPENSIFHSAFEQPSISRLYAEENEQRAYEEGFTEYLQLVRQYTAIHRQSRAALVAPLLSADTFTPEPPQAAPTQQAI